MNWGLFLKGAQLYNTSTRQTVTFATTILVPRFLHKGSVLNIEAFDGPIEIRGTVTVNDANAASIKAIFSKNYIRIASNFVKPWNYPYALSDFTMGISKYRSKILLDYYDFQYEGDF
jgi:hypothetical protein